jgi:hypothetical protein
MAVHIALADQLVVVNCGTKLMVTPLISLGIEPTTFSLPASRSNQFTYNATQKQNEENDGTDTLKQEK